MTLPAPPVDADPLADEIAAFARQHRLADRAAQLDARAEFPAAEFRAMGKARLLGLHLPASLGGRGLPLRRTAIALYHLARAGGTAFAKLALQPEFSSVLATAGGSALVDAWFRPLVRGERLVGNQITEPQAGADLRGIRTRARSTPDGYRIDGTKSAAAFAVVADAALVYARTDGSDGLTAFLVPQDLPGVERVVVPDLGERWMGRGEVTYSDVLVPIDHRVGPEGGALDLLRTELTRERALLAAIYVGVGRASWEETVVDVGARPMFGGVLAAQQAVAQPLVEDWARLDAAWLYADRVLARAERGEEVAAEAGLAKWGATEAALTAIDHAIQFHGGRGYSSALPHERRWRDVRSGRIAHGPSELLLDRAGDRLWPERRARRARAG